LRTSGLTGEPYDSLVYGGQLTISQEVARIVGVIEEQGGWLYALDISDENDALTAAGVNSRIGAIQRLQQIAFIPNQAGDEFELFVHLDGGVVYRKKQRQAKFNMTSEGLKALDGDPVGWRAEVAAIRVVDPVTAQMSGSNIITPERVSVADGVAQFVPLERTEADTDKDIKDNLAWIKKASER
jgi:hypothetical protein